LTFGLERSPSFCCLPRYRACMFFPLEGFSNWFYADLHEFCYYSITQPKVKAVKPTVTCGQ
jgi:hypothetical protein